MPRSLLVLLAALVCPSLARASLVEFTYSYSLGPLYFNASGTGPINLASTTNPDGGFTIDQGTGSVSFALAPSGAASATPGDHVSFGPPTSIPLGKAFASSNPNGIAGGFTYNASFTVGLTLKDSSGSSADLAFFGTVYGSPGVPGTPTGISLADYYSPWFGGGYSSVVLGEHTYLVALQPVGFEPFPAFSLYHELSPGDDPVAFALHVYVDGPPDAFIQGFPSVGPQSVPEPSTLLLGGSTLGLLALARLRRRRGR